MELANWTRVISIGAVVSLALLVVAACGSHPESEPFTDVQVFVVKGPPETEPTATVEAAETEVETRPEGEQEPQVEEERKEDAYLYRDHYGAAVASIEERIYYSDIIVRAQLVTAANDVLTFLAVEYLKGAGPDQFTVNAPTAGRDTQWDGNEAILFLSGNSNAGGATGSTGTTFDFTDTTSFQYLEDGETPYAGELGDGYTIDSSNPVWLPSDSTTGNSRSASGRNYIEAASAVSGTGTPKISLSDLRAKIAWIEGGEGIEDYEECIVWSLDYIRYYRDWWAYHGEARTLNDRTAELASGSMESIGDLHTERIATPRYSEWSTSGKDAALFGVSVLDDDDDPSNGYLEAFGATRPLPAGTYEFTLRVTGYPYLPCDFGPWNDGSNQTVVVAAPAGTVYEAFFDPTTTGFDSGGGELCPTTFTANGQTSTVTALRYENGKVVLETDPFNRIEGLHLYFIELDGSTGLVLSASSATVNATAGTLTWSVAEQPWELGDQLMLRITSVAPP